MKNSIAVATAALALSVLATTGPWAFQRGNAIMKRIVLLLLAGALALVSAAAGAQTPMRIRGTITSLDGDVLSVKTRDGKDLKINLAPNFEVSAAKAVTLADFQPGAYVGSTAKKNSAGVLVAVLKSSGLSLILCLAIGGLIGTMLFRHRRAQRAAAYSDAGGSIRLNLDELTEPVKTGRLLKSAEPPE